MRSILDWVSSGKIIPAIYDPIFDGLEDVARGLTDLDGRKTWGKVVVRVRRGEEARAKL